MAAINKEDLKCELSDFKKDKKIIQFDVKPKIGYVYSPNLIQQCNRVPNLTQRASLVHHLLESYGLLEHVVFLTCDKVDDDVMRGFHSSDYLDFLKGDVGVEDESSEEYGLGYDCPPLENLYDFIAVIAGGSVAGAKALVSGSVDVAVNFCGGWHHAQRDSASGFCYVNDCVLAILELETKFKRVLYIDLDIHHGDGVENAFVYSRKVFTLSLHKYEEGYFPGTGAVQDVGLGQGRNYSCNVPLRDGACDETFIHVFQTVLREVMARFRPEAIVCQCGADGLANDPLGTFNLTPDAYARCAAVIQGYGLPSLYLGGGGYHKANASRCFTTILAALLGEKLSTDIPEHDYFDWYGPSFELNVSKGLRRDENSPEYIRILLQQVLGNLELIASERLGP
ncbi:putative histone deacetylase 8-like [Daphnia sinensis]|uniref:Histone deacetylase n=1 Tax=Daphnia sinensis TaxID=1820382 RepID=A0AAD5PVA1_9CRUS|nr:putative histone deacetylase 8-like [Daphnia sinensis]